MISRNVRIQKAYIFHKIVAFLLDVLSYILLILVLYFSTLYLIFEPTLKYPGLIIVSFVVVFLLWLILIKDFFSKKLIL